MNTKITLLSFLLIVLCTSACLKDNENLSINTEQRAKELAGEINYLVGANFPAYNKSWIMDEKVFYGDVSGTVTISGEHYYAKTEDWSNYSTVSQYINVIVKFNNYQHRADYPLSVTGQFYLTGTLRSSGSGAGSPSYSGSHDMSGLFSVSGKFEGNDLELYRRDFSFFSEYAAILKVGDIEWEIN